MKRTSGMLVSFLLLFTVLVPLFTSTSLQATSELSIVCLSEVNEDSMFRVTVKSGAEVVPNATVTFFGENAITNVTGNVTFKAPRIVPDANNTFTITASKEGYQTANTSITIRNIPQLFPTVDSPYMTEDTTFVVTVIDDQGQLIENVTLTYEKEDYFTDENGTVSLCSPSVRKSETYTIAVHKQGYLSNSLQIIVSPRPSDINILGIQLILGICVVTIVSSIALLTGKYLKKRRINRY